MKKFRLLTLSALFFPFFSLAVYAGGPTPGDSTHVAKPNVRLQEGLLVYFPFNGDCKDASGHHNDGYLVNGGSLTYDEHGSPASAFGGNGYGGRIVVSNNGNMSFDSAFSVSFVGCIARFGLQDFVSILENSTGMAFSFSVGTHVRGSSALVFDIGAGPCDNFPKSEQQGTLHSDFVPQPDCWYEMTCTYNRGVMKMYVNGKLIEMKRTNVRALHVCPNAQLIVGGWWEKDPISMAGKLDEFRMYNRELNEAEVEELSKGFAGSTLPLHNNRTVQSTNGGSPVIGVVEAPEIGTISQEGVKDTGN